MSSKCIAFVHNACESADGYRKLILRRSVSQSESAKDNPSYKFVSREEIGLLLLKSKENYPHHVVLAVTGALIDFATSSYAMSFQQIVELHIREGSILKNLMENDECQQIIENGDVLLDAVNHLQLDGVWEENMLLNGEDLKKVFQNVPPGLGDLFAIFF